MHYATYFDRHYVSRGAALYQSLLKHSPPFLLFVLCLDETTERTLAALQLERLVAIRLSDLEQSDAALLAVKDGRLPLEYYWTCGPAFLLYVFQHNPQVETLTYLDSDIFFFGDPSPIYSELGANSILLVGHRYSHRDSDDTRGRQAYNVGLLAFRRSESGLSCLQRWREQCVEWCFDRMDGNRYADQGYLSGWPSQYQDVAVIQNRGAGLAPWNLGGYHISYKDDQILIDDSPLVFYHFSKVRRMYRWMYELHDWRFHRSAVPPIVRRHIYAPYVRELYAAEKRIRGAGGRVFGGRVGRNASTEAVRQRLAKQGSRSPLIRCRRFMFVTRFFVL